MRPAAWWADSVEVSFPAPCSPHPMRPPCISTATTHRTGRDSSWSIRVRRGKARPSPPLTTTRLPSLLHIRGGNPGRAGRWGAGPTTVTCLSGPQRLLNPFDKPFPGLQPQSAFSGSIRSPTQQPAASPEQVTHQSRSGIPECPTSHCPLALRGSLPPLGPPLCVRYAQQSSSSNMMEDSSNNSCNKPRRAHWALTMRQVCLLPLRVSLCEAGPRSPQLPHPELESCDRPSPPGKAPSTTPAQASPVEGLLPVPVQLCPPVYRPWLDPTYPSGAFQVWLTEPFVLTSLPIFFHWIFFHVFRLFSKASTCLSKN